MQLARVSNDLHLSLTILMKALSSHSLASSCDELSCSGCGVTLSVALVLCDRQCSHVAIVVTDIVVPVVWLPEGIAVW